MRMKVIYAGRAEGKTNYILEQCRRLEGRKLIIVPRTVEAKCLKDQLRFFEDENLKNTDIYSSYDIFVNHKASNTVYSYVFVDEIQTVLQYMLNNHLMISTDFGAEHIFATLSKECMDNLDDIRAKSSCETCMH